MASSRVVIKKYENRRLYDTSSSRYVNLEDLATMVRKGLDVHVVDAKTGDDLTRTTLMQVIAEDARGGPAGLPLELLRQLIVASDHVGKDFIMWYLKSAFEAYEKLQTALSSGLTEVQAAAVSPVDAIRNFLRVGGTAPNASGEEVRELRERIAELEARLRKPARKKAPRKSAKLSGKAKGTTPQ